MLGRAFEGGLIIGASVFLKKISTEDPYKVLVFIFCSFCGFLHVET